jgi:hypothetical protein
MPLEVDAEDRDHPCPAFRDRCPREFFWSTTPVVTGPPSRRLRTV